MRKILLKKPKDLLGLHQNAIKRSIYSSSISKPIKQNQNLLTEIRSILQSENWESILPFSKVPKKLNPVVIQALLQENHVGMESNLKKLSFLAITLCNYNLYGCVSLVIDAIIALGLSPMLVLDSIVSCYKGSFASYDNLNPKVFEITVDIYRVKGLLDEAAAIILKDDGIVYSPLLYNSFLRDLLDGNKLELFWKVCEAMPKKVGLFDVFAYTNMIKAHCMVGNIKEAKALFVEMGAKGCEPNCVTYNVMVAGLCNVGRLDEALEIKKCMIDKGILPNVFLYTTLINGFFMNKKWDDAYIILKEMRDAGVKPNVVTCNALINGYLSKSDLEGAFRVKDEMIASGVDTDLTIYNTLLYGLCRKLEMDRARKLVNEMISLDMKLDFRTFSLMIHGYCKVRRMKDAFALVDEMKKLDMEPNARIYGLLIIGLCHTWDLEKAIALLLEVNVKHHIDRVVYETCLSACSKHRDYKKCQRVFEVMKEQEIRPNEFCYGDIIGCLSSVLKMDEARSFMNEMIESGLEPNAHIFRSLISGFCRFGEFKVANKYFYAMLGRGLVPAYETYAILIVENCKSGKIIDALTIFRCVLSRKFFPDTRTYKVLINSLISCTKFEEVSGLLIELHNKGIVVNVSLFESVVLGLCKKEKVEEAYKLVEDGGFSPTLSTYNNLLKGFFKIGNIKRVKELFAEMKEKGLSPNDVTYGTMIIGFCKFKDLNVACELLDEMVQMGMAPNSFVYNCLVNCCYKMGDLEKANDLSRLMTEKGFGLTLSPGVLTLKDLEPERSQMGI
ncbi:uncharacterized protein [Rutidosis leptorrhynchoides]|uniref:uncharacterized protein n=1 Tax=Rutidosis leptorrhynchoides TaxID=125765 RepID=UPI003A99EFFD